MVKYKLLLLIVLATHLCAFGSGSVAVADMDSVLRFPGQHVSNDPMEPDSADVAYLSQKRFWLAAGETFGCNMGVWAFDRYVAKSDFAYISWKTIKDNFSYGFEWDNDCLGTNTFLHPYNGGLYFTAGRANGYNFWQSELFAIGGSAMWEMCMENERPSTNDIIATPIGGAAVGEVLYRMSDLMLDDRSTGAERFGRELGALLISPMRGLTRIFTGRAFRTRATTGRQFGVPPIGVELSTGARTLVSHDSHSWKVGGMMRLKVEYGDRFASATKHPYDYFRFRLEIQAMKTQPMLSSVQIVGRLHSTELVDKDKFNLSLGMFQHFDYFDSDSLSAHTTAKWSEPCNVPYRLGVPASMGVGALFRYETRKNWTIDGYLHANAVLLGGTLTDWYRNDNRDYNWGAGYSVKYGLNFSKTNRKLSMCINSQTYKLFTGSIKDQWDPVKGEYVRPVSNTKGDESSTLFIHHETQFDYHIKEHLYLSALFDYYYRYTKYSGNFKADGFETNSINMKSWQLGFQLMLAHKF